MDLKANLPVGTDEEHTAAAVVLPADVPAKKRKKRRNPPNRQRDKVLRLRLTQEEIDELTELAKEAEQSRTDYIMAAARGNRAVVIDGVPELMRELRRQGSNLNQLARLANQTGDLGAIKAIGSALAANEATQAAVAKFCVDWAVDLQRKGVR